MQCINVSGVAIQPAATLKSLGVVLDRSRSFDRQVSKSGRACHIRALRHTRDSLSDGVARTVACSIVSSRLDYYNALYAGMSANNFKKLQRVYKLATLTCKILHTDQPCYVNELIDFYEPVRQLCSSSQGLLYSNRSRTVLALRGYKHSSVAAWNNLTIDIRNSSSLSSFRSRLKSHLFCTA